MFGLAPNTPKPYPQPEPVPDGSVLCYGDLHAGRNAQVAGRLSRARTDILSLAVPIVVQMGDMTEDGITAQDTTARDNVTGLAPVVRTLVGNHDLESDRTGAAAQAAWGFNTLNWTHDLGPVLLLGISPDAHTGPGGNGSDPTITFSQTTIDWLAAQLDAATKECWVFAHAPLTGVIGGLGEWAAQPYQTIEAMLDTRPAATAWFSGHTHTDFDNLNIVTVKALASRSIINANCSAIGYVNPVDDPVNDPVRSLLATHREGGVILRVRDHNGRYWRPWPDGNYVRSLIV